jgi:hypothetical protein
MKVKTAVLFVVILFAGGVAHSAPIVGAAVQGWVYDAQTHTVSVRILNTSDKIINAFTLYVVQTDGNGVSNYHLMRDFLDTTAFFERVKDATNADALRQSAGPDSIPVGGSFDEKLTVAPTFKTLEVTLEAVAFTDGTASALSKQAIQPLIDQRKAKVATIDKATEVINASSTQTEAATNLQKVFDANQATTHTSTSFGMHPGELHSIISDVEQLPDGALLDYIAEKQRERSLFVGQSNLKVEVSQ